MSQSPSTTGQHSNVVPLLNSHDSSWSLNPLQQRVNIPTVWALNYQEESCGSQSPSTTGQHSNWSNAETIEVSLRCLNPLQQRVNIPTSSLFPMRSWLGSLNPLQQRVNIPTRNEPVYISQSNFVSIPFNNGSTFQPQFPNFHLHIQSLLFFSKRDN